MERPFPFGKLDIRNESGSRQENQRTQRRTEGIQWLRRLQLWFPLGNQKVLCKGKANLRGYHCSPGGCGGELL